VLSEDTLSDDADLRAVNVRRLLSLLRRLALLRGTPYVFEPNDGTLRRGVQRGFETLLTALYERGALAGATADEAFQVLVDGDAGAGQLVVELKVAPSLPLRFITIRLVTGGERGLEVVAA
jgi:phage tail sheath protein FI